MRHSPIAARVRQALCALALLLALAVPGQASAATGLALVIGNTAYTNLAPLPACGPSAHVVAAALRRAGFHVMEAEDATAGQMEGAIGNFAAALTTAPDIPTFVYVCSYALTFSGRSFLLPVSAILARPSDILTQGVLTFALLRTLAPRSGTASVVALDLVARPGAAGARFHPPGPALLPPSLGLVAVHDTALGSGPSPLAQALIAGLAGPVVHSRSLLAGVEARLAHAKPKAAVVALHLPQARLALAGGHSRAPTPRPAPPHPATPVAAAPTPGIAPTATPNLLLDGPDMTAAQRREVQTVLSRVGYYDGPIDGIFGPDTRAAIRRYQHEIHADMTGVLTGGQATFLVNHKFR